MFFRFKKELVVNYLYYTTGFIIPGILSFLFIPFVMRSYGANVYAEYSIAFNTLNTISSFCYGWVGHGFIRFYSNNSPNLYSTAFRLLIKSLMLGWIILTIVILFLSKMTIIDYCLLVPAYFLSGYYSFSLMICYAKQKAKLVAISETLRTIVAVFVPFIVFYFYGNQNALTILLLSLMISYILPLIVVLKNTTADGNIFKRWSANFYNKETARLLTGYGLPLALFFSFLVALMANDRFIIAKLLGYNTSGNYSAMYDTINKAVVFATAPIAYTFHPHIVKEYNSGNIKAAYISMKKALLLELLIFTCGIILLYLAGPALLSFVFKTNIPVGFVSMSYFIFSGVFIFQMAVIVHKPLELRMQTKYLAKGIILAFIFNITANYFLLREYRDVNIAAYTTLGASIFYICYVFYHSIKKEKINLEAL